jgi:hypothetical protein
MSSGVHARRESGIQLEAANWRQSFLLDANRHHGIEPAVGKRNDRQPTNRRIRL